MNNRNIIITAADHAKLRDVISGARNVSARAQAELKALAGELQRAEIVDPNQIPSDVITMNSEVLLHDLDTGERMEFTLVLPAAADINEKKISVLAPLGTAMLGYRVGDEFYFQPEATLRKAA